MTHGVGIVHVSARRRLGHSQLLVEKDLLASVVVAKEPAFCIPKLKPRPNIAQLPNDY